MLRPGLGFSGGTLGITSANLIPLIETAKQTLSQSPTEPTEAIPTTTEPAMQTAAAQR